MKSISRTITATLFFVAFLFQSCVIADAQIVWLSSSGKADYTNCESQIRDLQNFSVINNESPIDIILEQSNKQSVIVEGDEGYFSNLHTDVSNGRLTIKLDKGRYRNVRLRVKISCVDIDQINMAGSGDLLCTSDLKIADELSISLAGSGDVRTEDIKSRDLTISLAGSGDITVGNVETGSSKISIAGSGDARIDNLVALESNINIAGSGDINIRKADIEQEIDIRIAGSGDVKINGTTDKVSVSIVGSGDVSGNLKYNSISKKKLGSGNISFY